jgi:hypothetical protein
MEESPILIVALVVGVLLSTAAGAIAFYEATTGVALVTW